LKDEGFRISTYQGTGVKVALLRNSEICSPDVRKMVCNNQDAERFKSKSGCVKQILVNLD
jgi:hypothetical protein